MEGEPLIYTTSDSGGKWNKERLVISKEPLPDLFSEPQNPFFYNENEGVLPIVIHSGDEIFIRYMFTVDSGDSWSILSNNNEIVVPKEDRSLIFDSVDVNHI